MTSTMLAKKPRVATHDDPLEEAPTDETLALLSKEFESKVSDQIQKIEDQIKDASYRLEIKLLDMDLTIALAENKIALCLDPRYQEQMERLRNNIEEFNKLVGKHGVASTTLKVGDLSTK